jgi:hypothetical protein
VSPKPEAPPKPLPEAAIDSLSDMGYAYGELISENPHDGVLSGSYSYIAAN